MYFVYSTHKTEQAALAALEDMFANGDVYEAEHPCVERRGKVWAILLAFY
jgi:hypothetical protein